MAMLSNARGGGRRGPGADRGRRPRRGGLRRVDRHDRTGQRRATDRGATLERGSAAPSAAPSDAGYTGPEATITYSIWGDPTEIKSQQAIVDAFHAANPKITVKVTVSDWEPYWDKLLTSISGGDAPDVFAMDGPLFPDYQSRDVLLDLKPFIDRDGYDLGQLADQAVADFTTPGRPVRPAARPQRGRPLLQQEDVRHGRHPLPRRDLGLGQADRTWPSSSPSRAPTARSASGASTPRRPTWRTTGPSWSGRTAGTSSRPTTRRASWGATRPPRRCSSSRTSSGRTRSCRTRRPGRSDSGDAFEQGQAAMEANGSWLVATHLAAGIDFGIAPLPKGPAGQATSINPTGAVVYKGTKNPDAAWAFVKYLASPAAQTKIMELKASLPANKEVLAGSVRDLVRRGQGPRRRDRLCPPEAVVQGLQRLDDRAPDRARRERLHRPEQDRQAGTDRRAPAARRDPRRPVTSDRIARAPR